MDRYLYAWDNPLNYYDLSPEAGLRPQTRSTITRCIPEARSSPARRERGRGGFIGEGLLPDWTDLDAEPEFWGEEVLVSRIEGSEQRSM